MIGNKARGNSLTSLQTWKINFSLTITSFLAGTHFFLEVAWQNEQPQTSFFFCLKGSLNKLSGASGLIFRENYPSPPRHK